VGPKLARKQVLNCECIMAQPGEYPCVAKMLLCVKITLNTCYV